MPDINGQTSMYATYFICLHQAPGLFNVLFEQGLLVNVEGTKAKPVESDPVIYFPNSDYPFPNVSIKIIRTTIVNDQSSQNGWKRSRWMDPPLCSSWKEWAAVGRVLSSTQILLASWTLILSLPGYVLCRWYLDLVEEPSSLHNLS